MSAAIDHNRQRKVAVINDYSSFGRCSLAASVPILAAMRIQCCPVPTAVFTNHTGFANFSYVDLSERLDAYIADWKATGLRFSAIATGYMVSPEQIAGVRRFIETFRDADTAVVVDPVMGDYGRLYTGFRPEVAEGLRGLLDVADYLTPNMTEACVLAGRAYEPNPDDAALEDLASSLCRGHVRGLVITGVPRDGRLLNYVYAPQTGGEVILTDKIGPDRSGTGDVFTTVVLGELVNGLTLTEAVRKAVSFVSHAVSVAQAMEIPTTDGLPFEEVLSELWS